MMFELIVRPLIETVNEATAAMAEEIAEDCAAAVSEHFQNFDQACDTAAQGLLEATRSVFEAGTSFASDELRPRVESALAVLVDEAFAPLGAAQDTVAGILEAGVSAIELAAALAPPVNWARGTVDTINSLLDAMNLGL